jgi:hypothetical protein
LARSRSAVYAKPWLTIVGLLFFGTVILIPTWILLPADDEGLFVVINPTLFEARHLFGSYPLWNPFIEFGSPQPGSQSLIFHPFVVLLRFAPLAFSIGLLYQVQLWIGLVSLWAACRRLAMNRWVAAVCVITWALCSVTIQLQTDFWPDFWVVWTLAPLELFLLLQLIESPTRERRAFYSVAVGLCGALMVLDGHLGVFPVFGVGFLAFLIGSARRARPVLPWLGVAAAILVAASSSRFYDVILENDRSTSPHHQQVYSFDFRHFLFYPQALSAHGPRNVAYGLPFVALLLLGLLWVRKSSPYAWGLRLAVAACFIAWFLPVGWTPPLSGNWLYGQSFTLFSIFLAGLALQWLWDRLPRFRLLLLALCGLQLAILAYGFVRDFYDPRLEQARTYLSGGSVETLKNTMKNDEIYRYFEGRSDHSSTRVLMTLGARARLWRSLIDYDWAAWQWHGLRLVNGHSRGVDLSEFEETTDALHGEIRGELSMWRGRTDDLPDTADVLSVFNVGYILAMQGEHVDGRFVPVHRFHLPDLPNSTSDTPPTIIVAYRNPAHWGDAAVVSPSIKRLKSLDQRSDCDIPGLLCDDFSQVVPLRRPAGVTSQRWSGTTLDVRLAASPKARVLMVSQMYRPGWRAKLSNGQTVSGYQLLGGVTGFDIPPGVRSAEIHYHPTGRILFAGLSWAVVLLSSVFLIVVACLRRLGKLG